MKVGIIGAGAMGSGIAQIAAQSGHQVCIMDKDLTALEGSRQKLHKIMSRLVEKGRVSREDSEAILKRITYVEELGDLQECNLVIEAVIEDLGIKQQIFEALDALLDNDAILATNTSSLSVAAIASACSHPERVIGIHFFNPAPLMPLVEVIPAIQTDDSITRKARELVGAWGKLPVLTQDTPGFIVNRVARPFYGEALRIYEEGIADFATIDWAMKEIGGFRMGPFELMDFIGNDINYAVTESVFEAFYYDPRYKPSFTQKRYSEAGWLGKKSGRGYYDYSENGNGTEVESETIGDHQLGEQIVDRILIMLINEAADALYLNIASLEDIELAMTKGVNYPKGLLAWADEIGIQKCVDSMDRLYSTYHEDRYRCSPLLRRMSAAGSRFH